VSLGSGAGVTGERRLAGCNKTFDCAEHEMLLARVLWVVFGIDNNDLTCIELLLENFL
jgi:hypothetical protein